MEYRLSFKEHVEAAFCSIIREIPTIKLTRAELNETYGVPDNVVIVD